jgi:hypothetical protein
MTPGNLPAPNTTIMITSINPISIGPSPNIISPFLMVKNSNFLPQIHGRICGKRFTDLLMRA